MDTHGYPSDNSLLCRCSSRLSPRPLVLIPYYRAELLPTTSLSSFRHSSSSRPSYAARSVNLLRALNLGPRVTWSLIHSIRIIALQTIDNVYWQIIDTTPFHSPPSSSSWPYYSPTRGPSYISIPTPLRAPDTLSLRTFPAARR